MNMFVVQAWQRCDPISCKETIHPCTCSAGNQTKAGETIIHCHQSSITIHYHLPSISGAICPCSAGNQTKAVTICHPLSNPILSNHQSSPSTIIWWHHYSPSVTHCHPWSSMIIIQFHIHLGQCPAKKMVTDFLNVNHSLQSKCYL